MTVNFHINWENSVNYDQMPANNEDFNGIWPRPKARFVKLPHFVPSKELTKNSFKLTTSFLIVCFVVLVYSNRLNFNATLTRSTGLVTNLTSPTSESSSSNPLPTSSISTKFDEPGKEDLKGSIVGLRASKFSPGLSTGTSPEPKPRTTSATTTAPTIDTPSLVCPPKPKPLPKPRPWSIVGVDRKSGELTSVVSDCATTDLKPETPQQLHLTTSSAVGRKSSVRDMINNMNKGGEGSPSTATAATVESGYRRKGGSLPRGVQPPGSSASNSPNVAKKKDSTSDDPRILKLDDDFAFDDVMDV